MAVITNTLYSDLIPDEEAEKNQINYICEALSEKYFSDEELDIFAAKWFPLIATNRLLRGLYNYFSQISSAENYNRNAQANITRLMLRFLDKIYAPKQQPVLEPLPEASAPVEEKPPHTFLQQFLQQAGKLIVNIVRYPLYIFTRIFGSLNLAVSTFTSLDRSFWIPFFPHVTLSFLITLPIDLLFIATAVFQFQWFECSLFANALKVGHKKEIDPALKADRTTIKVTSLYNKELKFLRQCSSEKDSPCAEVSFLLGRFSRTFSDHVLRKEDNYKEYKEPLRKKAIRWGLNVIGGFLVCCLNAFTFKYTIAAFASSHAVTTLLPWLSALLCTPAAITILTAAAVIYGLVYYSAKRCNSPDHYHLKFIHNQNKISTFKQVWANQKNDLQQQEPYLRHHENEITYRKEFHYEIFHNKRLRDTYSEAFALIRRNPVLRQVESPEEEKDITQNDCSSLFHSRPKTPPSIPSEDYNFLARNPSLSSSDSSGDDTFASAHTVGRV